MISREPLSTQSFPVCLAGLLKHAGDHMKLQDSSYSSFNFQYGCSRCLATHLKSVRNPLVGPETTVSERLVHSMYQRRGKPKTNTWFESLDVLFFLNFEVQLCCVIVVFIQAILCCASSKSSLVRHELNQGRTKETYNYVVYHQPQKQQRLLRCKTQAGWKEGGISSGILNTLSREY